MLEAQLLDMSLVTVLSLTTPPERRGDIQGFDTSSNSPASAWG